MRYTEQKTHLIKVNLPGGVVSVGDLFDILSAAEKSGVENIRFGNRQNLYLLVNKDRLEDLEHHFFISDIEFEVDECNYPNIVSSYVSEDIFDVSNWLHEGVYKDVLDSFDFKPRLKVNLVDSNQTLIPFFTGNLNFISSEISNFWYLYIRFPKTNILHCWSSLIYSEDIPNLSKRIEAAIFSDIDLFYDQPAIDPDLLETKVKSSITFFNQPVSSPLILPDFHLPYYEGFNKYNNKYWLGIYQRNECFSVSFLKDICAICIKIRIGQIYTTSWKSVLLKGVDPSERKLFNIVLGKHRINVRHASNELNWQVEDNSTYGLNLKQHLVRQFDKVDLRTFKLCFAIKTNPKSGLFGSIIIKKLSSELSEGSLEGDRFDVLHTKDFNPNSKDFIIHQENVLYQDIGKTLIALCDYYYNLETSDDIAFSAIQPSNEELNVNPEMLYQCKHCLSVYDEEFGDQLNDIAKGTPFTELSDSYCCPICDSSKKDFILIEKKSLILN